MHTEYARDERRLTVVAAVYLFGLAAAVTIGKPGHSSFLPPCVFHALTGLLCPGCGTTRAMWYLVHGHPIHALGENALSVLLMPLVVYDIGAVLTRQWITISSRLRPWMLWSLLATVILFTVLRNIPGYPFVLLAPTDIR
jgi:hypothetical protein